MFLLIILYLFVKVGYSAHEWESTPGGLLEFGKVEVKVNIPHHARKRNAGELGVQIGRFTKVLLISCFC